MASSSRARHILMLFSIAFKAIENSIIEYELRSISVRSNASHSFIGKKRRRRRKEKKKTLSSVRARQWHTWLPPWQPQWCSRFDRFCGCQPQNYIFDFFCSQVLATVWLATKWLATKKKHLSHKKVPRPVISMLVWHDFIDINCEIRNVNEPRTSTH